MRKIVALALCLMFFALPAANAADLKIAVFDLQKVAVDSQVYKDAKRTFNSTFEPRRAALAKEGETAEKAEMKLTASSSQKDRENAQKLKTAYAQKLGSYMEDLQKAEARLRMDVDTIIVTAAENCAKKKGYNLVLDITAPVYSDGKYAGAIVDITKDVLAEANSLWSKAKK